MPTLDLHFGHRHSEKNNMGISKKWSPYLSLIGSLFLHIILLLILTGKPTERRQPIKPENLVEVQFSENKPETVAKVNTKLVEKLENQIVDQSETAINDEIPADTRFLSVHNQVVKKQTIAKDRGEFRNSSAKNNGESPNDNAGATKQKSLKLIDLKPHFDIAEMVDSRLRRENQEEQQQEQKAIQKAVGSTGGRASQSADYIKDLDPGLETLLSTKEFVFYTYYSRIRRQLNQYWGPKVKEKLAQIYRAGRNIASDDDKITKLLITLDKNGNLVKAQIIGNSGVADLDDAAIEAFKAAAPFPNPPTGMVDPDGQIKIRWDFILEA